MACLLCFSKEPLKDDELNTKYGQAYSNIAANNDKFDVTMCKVPCKNPGCWIGSMLCICPAAIYMRHKALNHVNPGSGWDDYQCCQGYFGGCCCIQPGQLGEKSCPMPCMCLEALCCIGPAVSATSMVMRERYNLGLDEDDVRLIRCNNCLFWMACCLQCVAQFTECEGDDAVAAVVNLISDIVFCCVSGCMTAQVDHEIKIRGGGAPGSNVMTR